MKNGFRQAHHKKITNTNKIEKQKKIIHFNCQIVTAKNNNSNGIIGSHLILET